MNGSKEGGFSNPPQYLGGQECPPSNQFLDPFSPVEQHEHRLPHWQQGSVYYFVTWRLADSLPRDKLDRWNEERSAWISLHPRPWTPKVEAEYHAKFAETIDHWLDAGEGSCVLRDPMVAGVVADALRYFDGKRYFLDAFVVMPNHVHILFRLLEPFRLEAVVQSWKGFTAREINKRLGRRGTLWQDDYWDRLIRNQKHWGQCRDYIFDNPVKAKLLGSEFLLFDRILKERGFSNPR